jgi:carbon monoxide dehydrogenase subunit G
MEMNGEERIGASRAVVWEALNDPEVLARCIPGCQSLEKTSESGFAATVKIKVGPVAANFKGAVTLENVNPPEGYTITGEGKGGIAGFAKGGADVHLADDGGATCLSYAVRAQVGGKLAQMGSRLIDSTSKKLAGQFFSNFTAIVTERTSAPSA